MKWLSFLATVAVLLAPVDGVGAQPSRAEPKRGDTYELTLTRDMAQRDNRGGTASSHDQDTLIERVVEPRADGLVLEYDFPKEATAQQRASEWHFPAHVFKPALGPMRLLNHAELEARIDGWLKSGGMTRANCGQLIFTWNAFRIDCDPESVTGMIHRFELTSFEVREGASYRDPNARGPARLTGGSSGPTLVADMAVDPDAVRRARAETDVGVAQLMRKSLTLEEALRERARDTVSGTISVTFETSPAGDVRRRTTVTKLEIGHPDGRLETETTTETLERRLVPPRNS
ncbi:MAG TPA: hypothetical protein VF474_15685 [Phenylobacterium sp.]